MRAVIAAALALALASPALAQSRCGQLSEAKAVTADHAGTWADATPAQYRFLQGVWAMNPITPPGLPYGDRAALATIPSRDGALVLFVDGERACTMDVPKELLKMLHDIANGVVSHEGEDN